MPDPNAEVRIKLVVDDMSKESLEKSKEGFRAVGEESAKAKNITKGLSMEILKGNIAFALVKGSVDLVAEGIRQAGEFAKNLAEGSLEAADAMEQQQKEMTGFMMLMDGGVHSTAQLRIYTGEMREEFEQFGLTSGYATKELVASYDKLIERGTMNTEQAKELTEQMAIVGRVAPGGIQALSQGMNQLEMGMARARNPIVQLISVTQTLHGNAQAVAMQMKKMTPEQQMALAQKALEKQAETLKKMGGVTPDLGQLKTSFEGVKESFLESMGKPMLNALIPQLVRLRDFLAKHIDEIKHFGEEVGRAFGNAIEYVSSAIEGIYDGLTYNWDEFKKTFQDIFGDWMAAWDAGKSSTGDIKQEFFAIGKTLRDIFKDLLETVKAAGEVFMKVNDVLHWHKMGTSQAAMQENLVQQQAMNPAVAAKDWDKTLDKYAALAKEAGLNAEQVDMYMAKQREMHEEVGAAGEEDKAAVISQSWDKVNAALQYNIDHHQDAMNDYIISQLATSDAAAMAIHTGAVHIAGGMDDFMKMIAEKSPELAAKIRGMANVVKAQGGLPPQAGIHIGVANFHIKQDFRDQDPDRIAVVFQKKMSSAVVGRTMARTANPSGF